MAHTGPLSSLPPTARRLGRGGRAFLQKPPPGIDFGLVAGDFLGTVSAVTWTVSAEQIAVPIPGDWKTHQVAGAETRTFTLRYQDVDDRWRMLIHSFFKAREADIPVQPPKFDILTKLTGGPVTADSSGVLSTTVA